MEMKRRSQFEHNMMTGKGGEFAVTSELLFRDFNANIVTVDSGIDIAALKDGQTFLFQVKTKHWNKNRQIYVDLELGKLEEFTQKNKMFFIVVGRYKNHKDNDYLIFPIESLHELSKKIGFKVNKKGNQQVRFSFAKRLDNVITLNKCGDVNSFRGDEGAWDLIE